MGLAPKKVYLRLQLKSLIGNQSYFITLEQLKLWSALILFAPDSQHHKKKLKNCSENLGISLGYGIFRLVSYSSVLPVNPLDQ